MSRSVPHDPCRIVDSDSENDEKHPFTLPKNRPITIRTNTPQMGRSISRLPKKADWDVTVEDGDAPDPMPSTRRSIISNAHAESPSIRTDSRGISPSTSTSSSSPSSNRDKQTVPIPDSPPASPLLADGSNYDPFQLIQTDLTQFIYAHIPPDYQGFIQCRLRRDTSGMQGSYYPTFYLQAERPSDGRKQFLLAAKRVARVNRQAEYIISTNVATISNRSHGEGYVGKLRGNNLAGTEYTLYDNGLSPNKSSNSKRAENCPTLRRELGGIVYNANFLGLKGPRQMNIVLPKLGDDIRPTTNDETILSQWRDRRFSYLTHLRNKSPKYNEGTKTYVIQFTGNRVVKPSVKNFQIMMETEDHREEVVMQFGRVDSDIFTCDYRYPLSAIQAFGIALSSFDSRLEMALSNEEITDLMERINRMND